MYLDYPYRIDGTGRTATTDDPNERLRNLIETVLFTSPGERVNRPNFGAGLRELVFDTNSEALATATEFMIQSTIQRFLADIVVIEALEVSRDEGRLLVTLTYARRGEEERVVETFEREV